MKKIISLLNSFKIPAVVLLGIILYLVFFYFHFFLFANFVIFTVIILGSYGLFKETFISLTEKQFALDYIAILAIIVGVLTHEYLVASILALMVASGRNLEEYGVTQAKKSLTSLVDRIPTDVTLWKNNKPDDKEKIGNVAVGTLIFIKKGEVVGLDGVLLSEGAEVDESSLTGEPYFIEKVQGDIIRSGVINIGQPMVIKVTKTENDSTYKNIINLVKQAEVEKSPFVRLADKYSNVFTLITFFIAGFSYIFSGFDLSRVLAVLAVATPCPLIIATPIALLGGVNASAKRKIIVKKLSSLEVLSKTNAILFDKTGTITLGTPKLTEIHIQDKKYSEELVLSIAEAIERSSLHPLGKALVLEAKEKHVKVLPAENIQENVGNGISGDVTGKKYTLSKLTGGNGMAIELLHNKKTVAVFYFEDEIKEQSKSTISHLLSKGYFLKILTGDKKEAAEKMVQALGISLDIKAECTPEDKQKEIEALKKRGLITAMVGDGINDAPALALSDVGIAFSNEEQTAASEAADIVVLGGSFAMILEGLQIAKKTVLIAKQSILWGIGLSIAAMVFASVGIVPPIFGAGLQEAIDVAVILNALRASR